MTLEATLVPSNGAHAAPLDHPTDALELAIATTRSATDNSAGTAEVVPWRDLARRLTGGHARRGRKDGPGWLPAALAPSCVCGRDGCPGKRGHRIDANANAVSALVLDVDKIDDAAVAAVRTRLESLDLAAAVHTSYSDRQGGKRALRVVIPLSSAVDGGIWKNFWRAATRWLAIPCEPACSNPSHFWYWPACPPDADPESWLLAGWPLDVDAIWEAEAMASERAAAARPAPPPSFPVTGADVVERARRYLATMEPAIAFQGGHNATFKAAQALVRGFGLDQATALDLMRDFNHRCSPPWDERDLERQVEEAATKSELPLGYLRDRDREGYTVRSEGRPPDDDVPPPTDEDAPPYADPEPEPAQPIRRSRPVVELAAEILAFAKLPRVSWGFAEIDRHAPLFVGGIAIVIGATGRGKTALLLQIGRHHATTTGPVLIVSAELIGAIAGARMVSAALRKSWRQVLEGDVHEDDMRHALDIPNMRIIDDVGPDILAVIDAELVAFAREFPGLPALILIDYLQLLPGTAKEVRQLVGDNAVALRKMAGRHHALAMVISKAGRAAAKELRKGDAMGVDLTEAGAETGAIEHEAMAMIGLGAMRPADPSNPDGPGIVDVSMIKGRFGPSDKVVPLHADLAAGRFEEHGHAVSATDRRAEAKAASDDAKVGTLTRAIRDLMSRSTAPMSKKEITGEVTGRGTDIAAAILRLQASGELVQVVGGGAKRKGGQAPWWTPEKAEAAGLTIVPKAVSNP